MRIGVDLRFTGASHMGTGSYAESVVLDLANFLEPSDELVGFSEQDLSQSGNGMPGLASVVRPVTVPSVYAGRDLTTAQQMVWDSSIQRERLDVYFAPTGIAPGSRRCPVVLTIHDLLFEHEPAWFEPALLAYLKREIRRSVQAADRVIAISKSTRQDIIQTYDTPPGKVTTLQQGLREDFRVRPRKKDVARVLKRLGISKPYFLALSNHAPHKNTPFAFRVMRGWIDRQEDHRHILVIAGGGPSPGRPCDLKQEISTLGLESRVSTLGRVDADDLPALYAGATAFLFPSLFEGYGLPPLEAISMNTPALVSDRGGLPEAVGNAARVLTLDSPDQWVDALAALVSKGLGHELLYAMKKRRNELFRPKGDRLYGILKEASEAGRQTQTSPLPRPAAMAPVVQGTGHEEGDDSPSMQPRVPGSRSVIHLPSRAMSGEQDSRDAARRIFLCGCMIIRDGIRLGYPFVEAIHAVIDHVQEMVVVDGCSRDSTFEVLKRMQASCPKLRVLQEPWPMIKEGGRAIAVATNSALRRCSGTHILYVQADEIYPPASLDRLQELLGQDYQSAAFPFLHFRSGWDKVLRNPAYVASIRCVPNAPGVSSVGDGVTFEGPLGRCAPPDAFPEPVYHVGWVYAQNILAKHVNHAGLYVDHRDYQAKARQAGDMMRRPADIPAPASIDSEYQLAEFSGPYPEVIGHLLGQEKYDPEPGLRLWETRHTGSALTHGERKAQELALHTDIAPMKMAQGT